MQNPLDALKALLHEVADIDGALAVLGWDQETYMPPAAIDERADQLAFLEALTHDKKSVIYRCLGDLPELEVDTFLFEVQTGDRLLLCCDGLWEMVPGGLVEDILLQYSDPQAACQRLISLANEAGGEDNISVVVVNIQSVT